jgi:tetratricopeptide (TPR) repeat protein
MVRTIWRQNIEHRNYQPMKAKPLIIISVCLVFASMVVAQDSTRVSIHQQESELHRWDVLKTHSSVPQLQQGAEAARRGDLKGAIRLFQKAAPGRPSFAYFNLGVAYFESQQFEKALRYFKLSHRARRDSVCLDYLKNTERLINERKRPG